MLVTLSHKDIQKLSQIQIIPNSKAFWYLPLMIQTLYFSPLIYLKRAKFYFQRLATFAKCREAETEARKCDFLILSTFTKFETDLLEAKQCNFLHLATFAKLRPAETLNLLDFLSFLD